MFDRNCRGMSTVRSLLSRLDSSGSGRLHRAQLSDSRKIRVILCLACFWTAESFMADARAGCLDETV